MSGSIFQNASSPPNQSAINDSTGLVLENVPCDASVYVGAAVRMDGTGTAFNAIATALSTANVIGIVQKKPSSTLCNIRVLGVSPAIFVGLDETKEYFLSATIAGEITTTVPTGSGHVVLKLGQPFSATRFLVLKGIPLERA